MRRLQHLAGVQRMEVGVIVAQPFRRCRQDSSHGLGILFGLGRGIELGQAGELCPKALRRAFEKSRYRISVQYRRHNDPLP